MFNHYSPTLHSYKWCGATTKKCRTSRINCAGEIPTFCKIQTGRNGSYHSSSHRSKFCSKTICFRSRILFSRTSALQSGIHRDEKEGTSIDDEFTKQKLITYMWLCLIFIVNSRCSTRVVNIQFNCDCATKENAGNDQGKNDAYFQFISLSSRIWCIQASRLLEINEFWKINLFCNPFPSIYNVNEKELALRKEKWWKRVHYL